ncbi:MAG: 50S ribosomal protein L17 [Thermogutta sp.]|nr:50S ribosomal protein L17 [Thermogutta sp.]
MRHRKLGRILGRSPSHRKALLRNLASALFLTEKEYLFESEKPIQPGQIVTTLPKAKEVRPLVERCITIAKRALPALREAQALEPTAPRNSEAWRAWRQSEKWREWNQKMAPVVAARRRVVRMIGSKEAVQVLFERIAPRFTDRPGGYTRIVRLAKPRVGDAGIRAILALVGNNDRPKKKRRAPSVKPEFTSQEATAPVLGSSDGDETESPQTSA